MEINEKFLKVNNNTVDQQFEVTYGDSTAMIQYRIEEGGLHLLHTEVPNALKGNGVAGKMARKAVAYANEQGYELVVWCPFLKAYFKKHPEFFED